MEEEVSSVFSKTILSMIVGGLCFVLIAYLGMASNTAKILYDNNQSAVMSLREQKLLLSYNERVISVDDVRLFLTNYSGVVPVSLHYDNMVKGEGYYNLDFSSPVSAWDASAVSPYLGGVNTFYKATMLRGISGEISGIRFNIFIR